jgi:hypothetical protein
MEPSDPKSLNAEEAQFLSVLARDTREHPERFAAGAELLQARFTFEVILRRQKEKLEADIREARRANERGLRLQRAHEIRAVRRESRKKGTRTSRSRTCGMPWRGSRPARSPAVRRDTS